MGTFSLDTLELNMKQKKKRRKEMPTENNYVRKFFNENRDKFETKRQASKYLNHYGKVWKEEHNIPLTDPKRR